MFSALPASEQSWSEGSDSLIIMHISAIWWVPNTGSTESPSTVSIKLHHSPFPFLLSPITACFAFMWETSGVIFSFWSIPAAITAELLMIVVVSKQYFPFSHTTGNTVFVPLPQTGRDCFPGHSLLERSSLHFSVSKSFVCRCWNGALCIYTFYKMFRYFTTSGVCVCLGILSAFVQNPVFEHNTLSLQTDPFPLVLRGDTAMDAHNVIHPIPWSCSALSPTCQPLKASQSWGRNRAAWHMLSINSEPLLNGQNVHPCTRRGW